jgi:hypothetical protein
MAIDFWKIQLWYSNICMTQNNSMEAAWTKKKLDLIRLDPMTGRVQFQYASKELSCTEIHCYWFFWPKPFLLGYCIPYQAMSLILPLLIGLSSDHLQKGFQHESESSSKNVSVLQLPTICESLHIIEERSNSNLNQVQPTPQVSNQRPVRRRNPTNTNDDFLWT